MRTRWWLLGLGFAGCSDPLPSPSTVDVLRILALTTATPELRPGEALRVRAVWFDPVGGRSVRWRWRLCDPGVADDPRGCSQATLGTELATGDVDQVEVAGTFLKPRESESSRTWLIYAIACPAAEAVFDPVVGRLSCPQGGGSEAFRRVTVQATGPLNQPPAIDGWTLGDSQSISLDDGATVAVDRLVGCDGDCLPITLTLTPAAGAAEVFGGGVESLLASVYVGSGSVTPPRVVTEPGIAAPMTVRWTPGRVRAGGVVARVWAVLRDQRGGETVRAVTVNAR